MWRREDARGSSQRPRPFYIFCPPSRVTSSPPARRSRPLRAGYPPVELARDSEALTKRVGCRTPSWESSLSQSFGISDPRKSAYCHAFWREGLTRRSHESRRYYLRANHSHSATLFAEPSTQPRLSSSTQLLDSASTTSGPRSLVIAPCALSLLLLCCTSHSYTFKTKGSVL